MAITYHTPKSSNIEQYSYDDTSRRLQVTFHGGRTYNYADVPAEVVDNMTRFRSVGEFFNAVVKPRYKVIDPNGENK